MKISAKDLIVIAVTLLLVGALVTLWQRPEPVQGSVRVGDQYQSTTTPQVADDTNVCPARVGMASSTTGILGAVNVLNANTAAFTIYDATTTNITKRNNMATSSLILAEFPSSPTEGSYHFDAEFKYGLLIDYSDSTKVSTTTVTFRCEG